MANQQKKTSIGGQALIEGILMRGPRKTAIVVRRTDGGMTERSKTSAPKPTGAWHGCRLYAAWSVFGIP